MNKKKGPSSRAKDKEELRHELEEALTEVIEHPNPIKRQVRIKQFPWSDKQKEFFKLALDQLKFYSPLIKY